MDRDGLGLDWILTLRSFVAAVQQGSLSGAGRILGYSPASISRHIAAIEEQLGAQLLKRSSRKLALTEMGDIYYHQVEKILRDLTEANQVVNQLQLNPSGILRVHSRMLVGQLLILPHIPEFLAKYPDITIDFMTSNFPASFMEQGVDIDIRIGKLEDSSLIARKLAPSERIICASPDYIASRPPINTPVDLLAHNCMTYRVNLGVQTWRFMNERCEISEIRVGGNFRSEFGFALLEMARNGLGIAMVPDWSVAEDLRTGRLVRLLDDHKVTHNEFEDGVYAVFVSSRQTSLKIRVFVDFLVGLFRQKFNS